MHGVGALGGRARARNLRLLRARRAPVARKFNQPRQETAAEAMRRIDALCPWLVGAERCVGRARAEERAMRTDVSCKENYASFCHSNSPHCGPPLSLRGNRSLAWRKALTTAHAVS
jgi:hypothetical protein